MHKILGFNPVSNALVKQKKTELIIEHNTNTKKDNYLH